MALERNVIETLRIINNELKKLRHFNELNELCKKFQNIVKDNNSFVTDLQLRFFIKEQVRGPLYEFYKSKAFQESTLRNKDSVFNVLMILAKYWPLNTKCCITRFREANEDVPERARAYLLSGHIVDKDNLLRYWRLYKKYSNPMDEAVTLTPQEVLWIFPNFSLFEYHDIIKSEVGIYTPVRNELVNRLEEKLNPLSKVAAVIISTMFMFILISISPVFVMAFAAPLVPVNLALIAAVSTLSVLGGLIPTMALKNIFCYWMAHQEEELLTDLKKQLEYNSFETARIKNEGTKALLKLVEYVKPKPTRQNQSVSPESKPLNTLNLNPEPPTSENSIFSLKNNWEKVGLHATRPISPARDLEKKEEVSPSIQGRNARM